jgi:hypothetical protein
VAHSSDAVTPNLTGMRSSASPAAYVTTTPAMAYMTNAVGTSVGLHPRAAKRATWWKITAVSSIGEMLTT